MITRRVANPAVKNTSRLAEIEACDGGKLLPEMHGRLAAISERWYCDAGLADQIQGAAIPLGKADRPAFTTREPISVVAALTAWKSPLWFAGNRQRLPRWIERRVRRRRAWTSSRRVPQKQGTGRNQAWGRVVAAISDFCHELAAALTERAPTRR